MLNRRGFIAALAAFASGTVLDPERLLWVPGAKTISIPAQSASLYGLMYYDVTLSVGSYLGINRAIYPRVSDLLRTAPISAKPMRVPFRINATA